MTTKAKWIIYGALALIAVLLIAIFSKNIVNGLENARNITQAPQ